MRYSLLFKLPNASSYAPYNNGFMAVAPAAYSLPDYVQNALPPSTLWQVGVLRSQRSSGQAARLIGGACSASLQTSMAWYIKTPP